MAPIVFGVPKVVPGVFLMALGLAGYWLFGLSRFRGWTLIGIFVVAAALVLYGVRLVWQWLDDRREMWRDIPPGETLAGRPWLRVPAWRRREIVSGKLVGTPVLALAYLFFGGPALFFLWMAFADPPAQSGESLRLPGLLMGSVLGFIVVGLTYWRLRHRRYGDSVCRLLTLPGRVGGWLKADVDCALPAGPDEAVVVRLKNMVSSGRSTTVVWRMEQRIAVPVQGKRTVVNVRLQIARSVDQRLLSPKAGALERFSAPWWILEIEKKVPGIDFLAQFAVPVYDAPEMPEAPAPLPRAEPAPSADPGGRRAATLVTAAGAAAFAAITHQASQTGWLSTSIMRPSAEWMASDRFQRELDVWSMSHYPPAIEGRCAGGGEQYRSEWKPTPAKTRWMAWYGMARRQYELKNREYGATGYTLESVTHYTDCAGAARVQAVWLKRTR